MQAGPTQRFLLWVLGGGCLTLFAIWGQASHTNLQGTVTRDDNNWTFYGVDATGIKDPPQEAAVRLIISMDAGVGLRTDRLRPSNLLLGASVVPPEVRSAALWINPAAFVVPARGRHGNPGPSILADLALDLTAAP